MKKHLLLLTLLGLSLPSLSANSYSWTGMYMKLLPAYSNLKLNYSGDAPYKMNLTKEPTFGSRFPYSYDNGTTHTIAEKVSAGAISIDITGGVSQEISESFGLIGEFGGTVA